MAVHRPALALALSALLLASTDACVLTAPDLGAPLRALRAEQSAQVEQLASTFCETYYACECMETYPIYEGEAECVEHIRELMLGHLEQGINEELEYDRDCLDTNIEMLEALGCTTADRVSTGSTIEARLDAAFQCRTYDGPLELGDECSRLHSTRGDECGPGLVCHEDFFMCFDHTLIAEHEPCGLDEQRRCESGLVCAPSAAAQQDVCHQPAAIGQGCGLAPYCERDAFCGENLRCQPLPRAGQPCVGAGGCAEEHQCVDGVCELAGGDGDPCGTCRLGLQCNAEGVCEPRRPMICDMELLLP